ncbi:hypothetical protein EUGRSUZ_C00106 [Eucalyptus grandis]|uniref:Uncharacterized protein n=2 Tax=Eucalyptus grandis TaxID=71139 RepID=A0ACC3L8V9_EUCGR|nr:hypothetical protein EUGRSUZ_C00106 [Eucalyptus grandis]
MRRSHSSVSLCYIVFIQSCTIGPSLGFCCQVGPLELGLAFHHFASPFFHFLGIANVANYIFIAQEANLVFVVHIQVSQLHLDFACQFVSEFIHDTLTFENLKFTK